MRRALRGPLRTAPDRPPLQREEPIFSPQLPEQAFETLLRSTRALSELPLAERGSERPWAADGSACSRADAARLRAGSATGASRSPHRHLPCTQPSCRSGPGGAELRERVAVALGLVFHRDLGGSRRAPGSRQPQARSPCRRSSATPGHEEDGEQARGASRRQGNVEKPGRGGSRCAGIVPRGNAVCSRAKKARPRALLGGAETFSGRRSLPRRGEGSTLHRVSAALNASSLAVSRQLCARLWLFHHQSPALAPLSPAFKAPLLLRPGFF